MQKIFKISLLSLLFWGVFLLAEEPNQPFLGLSEALKKSNLNAPQETKQFYKEYCKSVTCTLVWSDDSLHLNAQAMELLHAIQGSYDQGLNPNKYHADALLADAKVIENSADMHAKMDALLRIDILLSDAYMALAKDLYYGVTDWKKFKASKLEKKKKLAQNKEIVENEKEDTIEWERAKKPPLHFPAYLAQNLATQQISHSLDALSPDAKEYHQLMASLKYYRALHVSENISKNRKKIPLGATIRIQQSDERVPQIRARLQLLGELQAQQNGETFLYGEPYLIDAVKSFQASHNLTQDGLIGAKTIHALNISAAEKITKIILNLERFRWLNQGLDAYEAYIDINIPAFEMQVIEHAKQVIEMKVIVGKKERPTPILNSKISYAVLKPSWTAPKTIVKEDILQKAEMQEYLLSHNMRVYLNVEGELLEVDSREIDWSVYVNEEEIPYIFKADSGEANPLGEVKFIFENNYSIYMHDTNQRHLFGNENRALSSGCLRLSEPMKLLAYLLGTKDAIIDEDEATDKVVRIAKKLPLVIRYMTVGVDSNNRVYFYDDIYGYDELQKESLKENSWML